MERVLGFEEALAEVLRAAASADVAGRVRGGVPVALAEALGRVLAEPLRADRDQPPFARSTRDGFAVRAADVTPGAALRVLGMLRAGEAWTGPAVGTREAVEIMTGAPLPAGADAVLMIEHTVANGEGLVLPLAGRTLRVGENVVPRGAEARAGAVVVPAGRRIGAPEVAVAASCGYPAVPVFARPRVAILATGDELVEVAEEPAPWQIRNSNSYALAALVAAEGGEPVRLPVARDRAEDLRERLAEAHGTDLLLLSGGVSMGKYDLVEAALAEAGAAFVFTGARIQPGRPVVFGTLPGADGGPALPFFGLPGNPVSTEVCFRLFCAPLLRALCGREATAEEIAPRFVEARLADDVKGSSAVTRFLPAELRGNVHGATVQQVPWQGSGDLAANARANAFVVLPMGVEHFAAGDTVRVLLR